MSQQPEKFEGTSASITDEQKAKLKALFPEVVTEGGKVDFAKLQLTLGESVDVGKERYGMNWPGKADCFKTIQKPSMATLIPARDESVNFDTTENLIIEGDNLEVLKLLQKAYLGKVKMIYIDPPYNTGNDFIYPDDFSESLETYLRYTGQVDNEGRKFSTNTDSDGRFHSKWMNMMYPRLFLARNLLSEDGVIFISIDDNEVENLRRLCGEIFGEENFVSQITVQSNKRGQTYKEIAKTHEYLLLYSKNDPVELNELEKDADALPFKDSIGAFDLWELRNRNPKFGRFNRPNLFFPIYVAPEILDECGYAKVSLERNQEYSVEVLPLNSDGDESCWRWGKEKIGGSDLVGISPVLVARKRKDGNWNIYEKSRKSTTKAKSIWAETDVISEQGTMEIGELGMAEFFDHPKPKALISKCVQLGAGPNDIVLDFFGGSGTTAQSVLESNKADGGSRRFILVQLPEPTQFKEFKTIADITKERVRRVVTKLNGDVNKELALDEQKRQDRGFRVFKLQSSNFKAWNAEQPKDDAELEKQLTLHVDHLVEGRSQEDVLYELLIKSGFPLDTPIEKVTLADKTVFSIGEGMMLVCLEKELTLEVLRAIADKKPERVVCLDAGFANNDQLKTNAVQTMKAKGVTKFQTV